MLDKKTQKAIDKILDALTKISNVTWTLHTHTLAHKNDKSLLMSSAWKETNEALEIIEEIKKGLGDFVQIYNPKTKRYTKIDLAYGKILGEKKTKGPYKNIRIITTRGKK